MKLMLSVFLAASLVLGGVMLMGPAESGEVIPGILEETQRDSIRIDSDDDFPGNVSSGNGSKDNPWVIENHRIDANGTEFGVYVGNATGHFIIRNCTVYNASQEHNGHLQNASIILFNVTNALLMNNTANASANGILIYNSTCGVNENNVTGNANHGIVIHNSNCNVTYNDVSGNVDYGIHVLDSGNISIFNNNLSDNGVGLNVTDSEGCAIYHNSFIDNVVQAEDFTGSSAWDDGYPSGGNFWSDYDGPDHNYDGIGDTPYEFDGCVDRYPLMAPWTAPLAGDFEPPFALTYTPNGTAEPVDVSIIITWNETMNWTSVEEAFECTDGTTNWTSANGTWEHNSTTNVSVFTPAEPFLYETHYVVTLNSSAADIIGNMLDQNRNGTGGEWDDFLQWSFTTDDEAPYVVSTQPANGQFDVDPYKPFKIVFSESMNRTSVEAAFSYTDGNRTWNITDGSGYWNALRTELTFTPAEPLATNTSFTATLDGYMATDVGGKGLKFGNHTWEFSTWLEPPAPGVTSTYPPDGAFGVNVNSYINIAFDCEMDAQSVQDAFSYTDGADVWTAADGTADWFSDNTLFSFQPAERLGFDTEYTVTVTSDAKSIYGVNLDGNGNGIRDDFVFGFTTTPEPPTVVSHYPLAGQRDVPTNLGAIYINFSTPMLITSVSNAVSVSPSTPFTPTFSGAGQYLTLTLGNILQQGVEYRVTVLGTATDMTGLKLDGNGDGWPGDKFTFSFYTEGMDVAEPLRIIDVFPRVNSTIPVDSIYVGITFNAVMNRTSVQNAFSFRNASEEVNGTFSWSSSGKSFRFIPSRALAYNTTYTVSVTGTAKDVDGRTLEDTTTWHYTTESEAESGSLLDWVLYGAIIALLALCTILYMANRALRMNLKRTRVKLKRLKRQAGIRDEATAEKGGGDVPEEDLPEQDAEDMADEMPVEEE